jgi:hypothetical protein
VAGHGASGDAGPMAEATPIAEPSAGATRARRIGPEHRYGLLLAATIASLGVQGIVQPSPVQEVVVTALAGASLVLAARAAGLPGRLIMYAAVLAAAVIVVSAVRATAGGISEGTVTVMNAALVALGPPAVAGGVLRDLRTTGQVRIQAVMGVLALYILLGMFFAFLYGAIDHLGGGPFFANGNTATTSHCLYFSFTTLTTVGYGDFVARTDTGHTLAVFEALLGQIYLVTVVSLIVSNLGRGRMRRSEEA